MKHIVYSFLLLLSINCQSATHKIQLVEYLLVPDSFKPIGLTYNKGYSDTTAFKAAIKLSLANTACQKLGECRLSGSSYLRQFEKSLFGYNEVFLECENHVFENNYKRFYIQHSSTRARSVKDCPKQKFKCHADSAYVFNIQTGTDFKLIALVIPTTVSDEENTKITKPDPLQPWIKTIAEALNIDTTQTKHIPGDPAVMAFCNISSIGNNDATIEKATMLINEGATFLVIKASQIKQQANKPLTWIRGWDKCSITVFNGSMKRYRFSDPGKAVEEWGKSQQLLTHDKLNAEIEINIK
jgi:hypothetical protein